MPVADDNPRNSVPARPRLAAHRGLRAGRVPRRFPGAGLLDAADSGRRDRADLSGGRAGGRDRPDRQHRAGAVGHRDLRRHLDEPDSHGAARQSPRPRTSRPTRSRGRRSPTPCRSRNNSATAGVTGVRLTDGLPVGTTYVRPEHLGHRPAPALRRGPLRHGDAELRQRQRTQQLGRQRRRRDRRRIRGSRWTRRNCGPTGGRRPGAASAPVAASCSSITNSGGGDADASRGSSTSRATPARRPAHGALRLLGVGPT